MQAGEQFGSYRLISRIGAGGMGEVWKAEDVDLRRVVAIKILPAANAQDRESNERFKREARTAAQLNHPNIATIHAIDQKDERAFIVMEFVEGEPLSHLIRSGPLSEANVVDIAKGVAEALAEAHDKGIVHRDVKPDNIVVSGRRVKVLDFGIAKRYGHDAGASGGLKPDTEFKTEAGIIIGTVQYMSPEQAMGKILDGRSDIFSLGVVMYEALAGRLPFEGDSPAITLTRIIRDDPPHVRVSRPGLSTRLGTIVMRCLEKDPTSRFSTARELVQALGALPVTAVDAPSTVAPQPDENAVPTVITTPKPAADATVRKVPRTRIERQPPKERASVLPWVVAMVALVITSVVATAWYFTRNAKPAAPPAVTASRPPTPTGTEISVAPPATASAETATGTMVIAELAPAATAPSAPATESAPVSAARNAPLLSRESGQAEPEEPSATAPAPERAAFYYRKGLALIDRRQPLEAHAAFMKVVTIDPVHAAAWVRAGELALFLRSPQEAMEDFKKAAQIGTGLGERDALAAAFGRAIADGDVAAMDDACGKAPFDRVFNELRRAANKRGATDCPAPIGVGLDSGRGPGPGGQPGKGPVPTMPAKPFRRP